jgi:hypothetical protein
MTSLRTASSKFSWPPGSATWPACWSLAVASTSRAATNYANYPPVRKAKELYFSQAIIWVKEHPVLTRKDFMGNHEWCFYGWRQGAGHTPFPTATVRLGVLRFRPRTLALSA